MGLAGLYASTRSDLFAQYATAVGERRTIILPDGTSVELGPYSALSTLFTGSERRVDLFRGEGFFDLAADSGRPFLVEAGGGTIRALDARFDVKCVDDLVTVTVGQSRAEVGTSRAPAVEIDAGWQVSYDADGLGAPVEANLDVALAWRQDRIVFHDVPLRRVLAELERYRRGKIVLMDRNLGRIPVTAIFDTRQAEKALQTIADTLPIRVLYATGYVAIVYAAG